MKKNQLTGLLSNAFEHYDKALYGLLAPFLAPLFFGEKDPVFSLIMTYLLIPIGMLIKPFGAFILGSIADAKGRAFSLKVSLWGTSITTVGIGLLPTYKQLGVFASFLLIFLKLLQSFFSSSETTTSAVYVMEQTSEKKRTFISALIDSSSIFGMLIASACLVLFTENDWLNSHWRWLFIIGAMTFFIPCLLKNEQSLVKKQPLSLIQNCKKCCEELKKELIPFILIFGFSSMMFHLAFTFMNGYSYQVLQLSFLKAFQINTALLIIDIFLLIVFALFSQKWGKIHLMKVSTLTLAIAMPFLFLSLNNPSFYNIFLIRLFFIIIGAAFSCSLFAFCLENAPSSNKTTLISLASSLGSQLIGAPSISLCFYLNKTFSSSIGSALLISITALASFFSIYYLANKQKKYSIN